MTIGTKLFLCITLIVTVGLGNFVLWTRSELNPRYREAVEEPLVDIAVILASLQSRQSNPLDISLLRQAMEESSSRAFKASVYALLKEKADLRLYVTDEKGIVLFHSFLPEDVGQDYSNWRDVALSLKGEYGARSTRDEITNPNSTVFYVAAPIISSGKIVGVLSVGKPTKGMLTFIEQARRRFFIRGAVTLLLMSIIGVFFAYLLTRPVRQLTEYARAVRDGKPTRLPSIGSDEMGSLAQAFEEMRESLEGRKYIEQFVQSLTHELKSPVSGIQGAAELLHEDLPPEQRRKFLDNIERESRRIEQIVERLLQLYSVESKRSLSQADIVDLTSLLKQLAADYLPRFEAKGVKLTYTVKPGISIRGDRFLLQQSFANLLDNALDFTGRGGKVKVSIEREDPYVEISVEDNGTGIPGFALGKVYDKFFSLPRPESGNKSSGLGLSFVQEVAKLHQGEVKLENVSPHGVRAAVGSVGGYL